MVASPPPQNWANQTVWTGDNLDIMRGMNSASVDAIYLDPPFNSNANYAAPIGSQAAGAEFKDTWGLDDLKIAWHALIKQQYPALYDYLKAVQSVHGKSMMAYLIYMSVRIIEMRRLLNPTGSIYLHCDPTASHYLKLLMDCIFGRVNFRNEIVWKRFNFHADAKRYGAITDRVLFYSRNEKFLFNRVRVPYSNEYIQTKFTYSENNGRKYCLSDLNPPNGRGPSYEFYGITKAWRFNEAKMKQLDSEGRIYFAGNTPRLKRYLDEMPGQAIADLWGDISPINSQAKERVGYPTQKPLKLLQRIWKASVPPDGTVLDPFCGCATACIAAEIEGMQWAGIDISPKAAELVRMRMEKELGLFFDGECRTDIPRRTDQGDIPRYNNPQNKMHLYGQQGGHCNGCKEHFETRHLEIDHVIPRSKGGTDHLDNLQLLCGSCNRIKGNRPHEYLVSALRDKSLLVMVA